jgi:hypothetical protein
LPCLTGAEDTKHIDSARCGRFTCIGLQLVDHSMILDDQPSGVWILARLAEIGLIR